MTTRGRNSWMRTVVLTVGIVLLGLTLLPPAAGATLDQGNIHANAMFQISLCEAGGGRAQVDVGRYGDGTIRSINVTCVGGAYGGMWCNNSRYGVDCTGAHPHPVPYAPGDTFWPIEEVIPVLESGSPEQLQQILADLQATNDQGPDASPSVDSGNPQDHHGDTAKSKGKKGKHGKKGGKHRKH